MYARAYIEALYGNVVVVLLISVSARAETGAVEDTAVLRIAIAAIFRGPWNRGVKFKFMLTNPPQHLPTPRTRNGHVPWRQPTTGSHKIYLKLRKSLT